MLTELGERTRSACLFALNVTYSVFRAAIIYGTKFLGLSLMGIKSPFISCRHLGGCIIRAGMPCFLASRRAAFVLLGWVNSIKPPPKITTTLVCVSAVTWIALNNLSGGLFFPRSTIVTHAPKVLRDWTNQEAWRGQPLLISHTTQCIHTNSFQDSKCPKLIYII